MLLAHTQMPAPGKSMMSSAPPVTVEISGNKPIGGQIMKLEPVRVVCPDQTPKEGPKSTISSSVPLPSRSPVAMFLALVGWILRPDCRVAVPHPQALGRTEIDDEIVARTGLCACHRRARSNQEHQRSQAPAKVHY